MSSIFDRILGGRIRRRQGEESPVPDPGAAGRNRTVLKAAMAASAGGRYRYKEYESAAFPGRIPEIIAGGTQQQGPEGRSGSHDEIIRRAVHYTNAQLGIQGLVRSDFSKELNDRLARHAIFAICEKAMIDYFGTAEWEIVDEAGKPREAAMKWLRRPNPHQTLNMVLKEVVRDTIRYDAGVIVNSLRTDGTLGEVRAYHGPDFWIEIDRDWQALDGIGSQYYGPWSHGLIRRYWQHSRPGIYIPFEPDEVCYFMLYPRTDSMYGTDFISLIRWQLEYLIDSTRAAGMTFANGLAPGAIWKHPDYVSIEELAERELDLELNHLGPANFGGILHLIGNESIESFTPTLHDMQWLEGQKFITEIVLAMWGFSGSEFFQGDATRATAYIARNITKSRMLYPLQTSYEQMITEKILPLIEGWEDDWEFKFVDTVDLDDELKRAQINQTRASTAQSYAMLGISIESALELAEVPDDLQTAVRESIEDLMQQEGSWTEGLPDLLPPEEAEQYYGDPGGEDYTGTAVDGDNADDREDDDGIEKAGGVRIYLEPGEKPPAGVQVRTGPRGGRYYDEVAGGRRRSSGAPAGSPRGIGESSDDDQQSGIVRREGVSWMTGKTDLPIYDSEIQDGSYRYTSRFVWMDAKAFRDYQIKQIGLRADTGISPRDRFYDLVDEKKVDRIRASIERGRELPAFFLEFDRNGDLVDEQEGRHRIVALIAMGVKDVPVWLFRQKPARGHDTPGDPPLAVDGEVAGSDDDDGIEKAAGGGVRVYLKPGESAPSGVQVRTGPRGGKYYLSSAATAGAQPATKTSTGRPDLPPYYGPPARPWDMANPDLIRWAPGEAQRLCQALSAGLDLEEFAHHMGRAVGPGLMLPGYDQQIQPDRVIARHPGSKKIMLMRWRDYQHTQCREYGVKPKPPIIREVDEKITGFAASDWDQEEQRYLDRVGSPREVGRLFTRDGDEVFSKVGLPNRIDFTRDEVDEMGHPDGRILTHTHPSSRSFSIQDLLMACKAYLSEIRAVGDEYECIFLPPLGVGQFTPEFWNDEIGDIVVETNNSIYEEFMAKMNRGEMSIDEADKTHHHTLWMRVSEKTRLRYIRRSRYPGSWEPSDVAHLEASGGGGDDQ